MFSKNRLPRRDFLRNAVMLAGAGVTAPLWAAMKYDRDAALRHFRACASETEARVRQGVEANRKGDATLVFRDAQGRPCERVHAKVRQLRHDFKYGMHHSRLFRGSRRRGGAGGDCPRTLPHLVLAQGDGGDCVLGPLRRLYVAACALRVVYSAKCEGKTPLGD